MLDPTLISHTKTKMQPPIPFSVATYPGTVAIT